MAYLYSVCRYSQ